MNQLYRPLVKMPDKPSGCLLCCGLGLETLEARIKYRESLNLAFFLCPSWSLSEEIERNKRIRPGPPERYMRNPPPWNPIKEWLTGLDNDYTFEGPDLVLAPIENRFNSYHNVVMQLDAFEPFVEGE